MNLGATGPAQAAIEAAAAFAAERGDEAIGALHLLVGVTRLDEGSAVAALDAVQIDRPALVGAVQARLPPPRDGVPRRPEYPFEESGAAAMRGALQRAVQAGGEFCSAHVLSGVLDAEGEAVSVLREAGVAPDRLALEVERRAASGTE